MAETILLTHGCSLSNLPLFVAAGAGLFAEEGLEVEVPHFTSLSSTSEVLSTGAAQLGTAAFVEPLIAFGKPNSPVMVGGSGLMGISLLATPSVTEAAALKGHAVGTFRGDPLEVLLYDVITAAGLEYKDLDLRYLDDIYGALEAFERGELAAITLAEPHASRLRDRGAIELSDGTELWGNPFPDTVLVAARSFLQQRPDLVSAALRAMLRAETVIAADPRAALDHARRYFPGFDLDELARAARRQPPRVDIRTLVPTVFGRWSSLQALALVPRDAEVPRDAIALELLETELDRLRVES